METVRNKGHFLIETESGMEPDKALDEVRSIIYVVQTVLSPDDLIDIVAFVLDTWAVSKEERHTWTRGDMEVFADKWEEEHKTGVPTVNLINFGELILHLIPNSFSIPEVRDIVKLLHTLMFTAREKYIEMHPDEGTMPGYPNFHTIHVENISREVGEAIKQGMEKTVQ